MGKLEDRLLELKGKVDEAKSEVSEITGRLSYLRQELEEKWQCDSVEAARQKIQEMEQEITGLETQLEEGLDELEQYNLGG